MFRANQKITNATTLFDEMKCGNLTAFERLFHVYYPRLLSYAIRFVRSEEEARDLVQDAFINLWEKRSTLSNESISSLLFTMVRNACMNRLKHLAIVENYQSSFAEKYKGNEQLYQAGFMNDTAEQVLFDELQEQIALVITNLPTRCQEVFLLSRTEGLKNSEIAEQLHISIKAVEKHITRALGAFEKHFKTHYR